MDNEPLAGGHSTPPDPGGLYVDGGPAKSLGLQPGSRFMRINPRAVARYRERYGQAGGKSDPGDAVVLADICAPTGTFVGPCLRSPSSALR